MSDLTFPQLSSGAMAQYPIKKAAVTRTIKNILGDGSLLVAADSRAGQLVWNLSYIDLSAADMSLLQSHFEACRGPLRAFTFLDPTDNLLRYSSDLTASPWIRGVAVAGGLPDPMGGNAAFRLTNNAGAPQEIAQSLPAPANYQYCFSVYVASPNGGTCSLVRRGASSLVELSPIGPLWSRISSTGRLYDSGTEFTVAVSLAAGQTLSLFGPQLEPQFAPSRFRPTAFRAGVYSNAHWAVEELVFSADGPNRFSTSFTVEASNWT